VERDYLLETKGKVVEWFSSSGLSLTIRLDLTNSATHAHNRHRQIPVPTYPPIINRHETLSRKCKNGKQKQT
jgi:hypothetical protein